MYNLSKYFIISILSIIFCICSKELKFNSSIYNHYIIIGAICCIYYIIDLVFNNLIENYDNNNTTYKADTYNSNTEDFISWIRYSKMFFPIIISGLAVVTLLYL